MPPARSSADFHYWSTCVPCSRRSRDICMYVQRVVSRLNSDVWTLMCMYMKSVSAHAAGGDPGARRGPGWNVLHGKVIEIAQTAQSQMTFPYVSL